MKRRRVLATCASLGLFVFAAGCAPGRNEVGPDPAAADDDDVPGRAAGGGDEARADIRRGHLALRGHGLPVPWAGAYARLLSSRLGVGYEHVAGCVAPPDLLRQTFAYNQVMVAEIERRHGPGVLDRLRAEARSGPAATRPAE